MNWFKIIAVVDDVNSCECCGKTDLQRTVAIEDLTSGEIKYFGTSCALQPVKGFGIEKKEIAKEIKLLEEKQRTAKREAEYLTTKRRLSWCEAEYVARGGTYYEKINPAFVNVANPPDGAFLVWTLPHNSALEETIHLESMELKKTGFFDAK